MYKLERRAGIRPYFVMFFAGLVVFSPFISIGMFVHFLLENELHYQGLIIFMISYIILMLGATVGCHRYFSHRSFKINVLGKIFLVVSGNLSQGSVIKWAAVHRHHHIYSDQENDIHSPTRFKNPILSFLWSHMLWTVVAYPRIDLRHYVRDWHEDKVVKMVDYFSLWYFFSFPFLCGFLLSFLLGDSIFDSIFFEGFMWGLLAQFCVQHVIFCINSVCHIFGEHNWDTSDHSKNNIFIVLLGFGEGWHNNHHRFPYRANFSVGGWQIDCGYLFIKVLEFLRIAKDVKHKLPKRFAGKKN